MMPDTITSLQKLIESFSSLRIAVLGDLVLDRYVRGDVDRISPEAPVVVVRVTGEQETLGGSANVANNLSALGVDCRIAGAIGNDHEGAVLTALLTQAGIEVSGLCRLSRPTSAKTRILARGQQVVRVDKEETAELDSGSEKFLVDWIDSQLDDCDAFILSDYGKGVITAPILKHLAARFVDGGLGERKIPLVIDPKDKNFGNYAAATLVTPNRSEASAASGIDITSVEEATQAGRMLSERWNSDSVLVTLSEDGMALVSRSSDTVFHIPTKAQQVFDVTGAGDTVVAVVTSALAAGAEQEAAAALANLAAGHVVAKLGAATIDQRGLIEEIEKVSR